MDFIEDEPGRGEGAVKRLGVGEQLLGGRQVAVHEPGVFAAFRERGLPDAANARQPDDGGLAPRGFEAIAPKRTGIYAVSFYVWSDSM